MHGQPSVRPPSPMGPMPVALRRSSASRSSAAISPSGDASPSGRSSCRLASRHACSIVPPIPTPTTTGGQAHAPAETTVSTIASSTPVRPAAGVSIQSLPMFSLQSPLRHGDVHAVAFDLSEMHHRRRIVAVFTRDSGESTDLRRYPSV